MKLTFNYRPLSLNNVYDTAKSGRRFLNSKGKKYKRNIYLETLRYAKDFVLNEDECISLKITFYLHDLLTKKGTIKQTKPDLSNSVKLMEDAIFDALKLKDHLVLEINCKQKLSDRDFIEVEIIKEKF